MDSTRIQYWRGEIEKAARAANAWYRENAPLGWGDDAHRTLEACESLLVDALRAVNGEWGERTERLVRAKVESVYAYISEPIPKWTDVVQDTKREVTDIAATVGTWGAGGVGLGLVLLGGLWLYLQVK